MDLQNFNLSVSDQLDAIRDILVAKGAEYVPGDAQSRFHNFEVGAALNGQTNTECLWGYLTKHLVSLADMAKGDSTEHSMEKWTEKLSDAITYLVLLKAMVADNEENDALQKTLKAITEGGVVSKVQVQAGVGLPPSVAGIGLAGTGETIAHHTSEGGSAKNLYDPHRVSNNI